MSDVFVARQPIFTRALDVVGYELLFRRGTSTRPASNPEGATATVVLNSLTEIGLDRLVGNTTAWINVSRTFVLEGLADALPAELVGLEIGKHELLDDELIAALAGLKERGYKLALDDFSYRDGLESLLPLVDVVKLDPLSSGAWS